MNIEQAKQLKRGDRVICPADRGFAAYVGTVTHDGTDTQPRCNYAGVEYIWVEVYGPLRKSVWPSNRLELLK